MFGTINLLVTVLDLIVENEPALKKDVEDILKIVDGMRNKVAAQQKEQADG